MAKFLAQFDRFDSDEGGGVIQCVIITEEHVFSVIRCRMGIVEPSYHFALLQVFDVYPNLRMKQKTDGRWDSIRLLRNRFAGWVKSTVLTVPWYLVGTSASMFRRLSRYDTETPAY